MDVVLVEIFIAVKGIMTMAILIKEKYLVRAGLQVQNFSPSSSWWEA